MTHRNGQPLRRLVQEPALVERVLHELRARILNGALAAGEELPPEGALAHTLGVSRTVVREAMRGLRAQGLVEVSQGRKPRVKPAGPEAAIESLGTFLQRSERSVLDLIEVRRPLESEIAALAAQRASPQKMEEMAKAIEDQLTAPRLEQRIEADMRFHRLLAQATGNPLFEMLLTAIWGLLRKSLTQTISRTGAARAAEGHERVLAAVRRRAADQARKAMLEHLAMAEEDLRKNIRL